MYIKSLLSLLCFTGASACNASACVFSNPYLRFGSGSQNSVNNWGLFVQPWYFSETANQWYKLTYSGYPLDTAIGSGYGSAHWSGTSIVDLYSLTPSASAIDYSDYVVSYSDAATNVGYGKIVATSAFVIGGKKVLLENTFSLGAQDKFVKIISRVINNDTVIVPNIIIWTGTRDDYVGSTDTNTKSRGNLDTGSFVEVTSNTQSSRAIMITNTNEGVLFYSETAGVMTAYASCCQFSNSYNTNPLSLPPRTLSPTDGSYAAVLPIGDIAPGSSGSITWYYAAGTVASLSTVAQSVAVDQVASGPALSFTSQSTPSPISAASVYATVSSISAASVYATVSPMSSGTAYYTVSPISAESVYATVSPISAGTAYYTLSPFSSVTQAPLVTLSAFNTESSSPTPSTTPSFNIRYVFTQAPMRNISISQSVIITQKESAYYSVFIIFLLSILSCVFCAGLFFGIRYFKGKGKEKEMTPVLKVGNELFRSAIQSEDIESKPTLFTRVPQESSPIVPLQESAPDDIIVTGLNQPTS